MLNPESNRVNYAEELTPPGGYRLERAVATTYSLDLAALVAAAIPLGLSQVVDDDDAALKESGALLAIQKIAEKIVVFCEAGQMPSPRKRTNSNASKFLALLDSVVVSVALDKRQNGCFPAFHPKVWLLEFTNVNDAKDHLYRCIVMSRNLTFDRSWDVSVTLDGHEVADDPAVTEKNAPLIAFLEFLETQIEKSKGGASDRQAERRLKIVQGLKRALAHVKFEIDGKLFDDFEFVPSGFGDYKGLQATPLLCAKKGAADCSFHDLVVVSPFLTSEIVEQWNGPMNNRQENRGENMMRRVLITRQEALNGLRQEQVQNFTCYVLKSDVVSDANDPESEGAASLGQDIHAKIYLRRKGTTSDLFIGSANATRMGLGCGDGAPQNVEMMIRLRGKKRALNIDAFLKDLFCGKDAGDPKCPFEEVKEIQSSDSDATAENVKKVERAIKEFCRCKVTGSVREENGAYAIDVRKREPGQASDFAGKMVLAPLCAPENRLAVSAAMTFSGLPLKCVSEFFVITATLEDAKVERIVQIPLANMPEQRDAEVIRSLFVNAEAFCRYLMLILSPNPVHAMSEYERKSKSEVVSEHSPAYLLSGLYEEMLKAAAGGDQERIRDVKRALEFLPQDGIEREKFAGLENLYESFEKVLPKDRKRKGKEASHG